MIQGKTIICEEVFVQLVRLAAERVDRVNLWEHTGGGSCPLPKGSPARTLRR